MSKKPPKISDKQKEWMKPRRDKKIILAPEYHLIVTEGTKTEPYYFDGLRAEINSKYPGRVSIFIEPGGAGLNTLTLLERAQKVVQNSPINYKHIWLVFDKDDFPNDNFDNTCARCKDISNEDVEYHALWSNECIEYWFLLHFMYMDSAIHRSEYFSKLSDYMGIKYEKNSKDIYAKLRPSVMRAVANAKRIQACYSEGTPPSKQAPATKVYEIFDKLKEYLKK